MEAFILIAILALWIFNLNKKGVQAFVFLLYTMIIYYKSFINGVDIDIIIKFLILITLIIYGFIFGFKAKVIKVMISLACIMYALSFIGAQWTLNFGFKDSITAFISFFIGIIIFNINWDNEGKSKLLKAISKMAIISLIIGIPLDLLGFVEYFGRSGTAIAGASLSTNLSFFGTCGVMSSIILYNINRESKYRILSYINFIIVCTTLTRGGIIVCLVVLLPDIKKFFKEMIYSANHLIIFFTVIMISTYPSILLYNTLIKRTFTDGQLNTSGREKAWTYIISLVQNKWFGNGYGCLKTLTDDSNLKAFTAAHNEYIRIYFETGIIGAIITGVILSFVFYNIFKHRDTNNVSYLITIVLGFLIYSFTDNSITNFRFWIPFMTVISAIGTYKERLKLKL